MFKNMFLKLLYYVVLSVYVYVQTFSLVQVSEKKTKSWKDKSSCIFFGKLFSVSFLVKR